jgi:hypothetical protein
MKNILLMLVVSFVLFGCASAPVEFNPTETPFEGEWLNWDSEYNKVIYKFTGNSWEFTYKDFYSTGPFSYNNERIYFTNEQGKWTQNYEFKGSEIYKNLGYYRFNFPQTGSSGHRQTGFGYYTKQPYGDLVISYLTKEKKFSDIVTNKDTLTRIQGTWRSYNKRATYTFSSDQFTVTATDGRKPISGNVKIADNILCLIVSDELFGLYYLDFLPNNRIFLHELYGHPSSWWGQFIRQ